MSNPYFFQVIKFLQNEKFYLEDNCKYYSKNIVLILKFMINFNDLKLKIQIKICERWKILI